MPLELSDLEARLIGCLIEKQIATPDQYPLSLNALTNACNQRSNRDPVMNLDERQVQGVLDALVRRNLVLEKSGFGSRVPKYHQIFCNTEFGSLQFSPQQTAIVCELLLRGPQTPGELRTHAARLAPLHGLDEVELALEDLATRPEGPWVVRLEREPGRREARYAQLFTGEPRDMPPSPAHRATSPADGRGEPSPAHRATSPADGRGEPSPAHRATSPADGRGEPDLAQRVAALEAQIDELRRELADLRQLIPG